MYRHCVPNSSYTKHSVTCSYVDMWLFAHLFSWSSMGTESTDRRAGTPQWETFHRTTLFFFEALSMTVSFGTLFFLLNKMRQHVCKQNCENNVVVTRMLSKLSILSHLLCKIWMEINVHTTLNLWMLSCKNHLYFILSQLRIYAAFLLC